ncbi:MAG: AMP-binding protein [Zoogloeaceae bacterium]|nr:AMP-binding protein [Zoogloeaceae bacterium]
MVLLERSAVSFDLLAVEDHTAKFDLNLNVTRHGLWMEAELEYATDLFEHATIERLVGHMRRLLEGIVAAPEKRIGELPLLTLAEERQLLVEWNATTTASPHDRTLGALFAAQAERRSEAIAVSCRGETLTYGELAVRANQLAWYLRRHGWGRKCEWGYAERSPAMAVALLGIVQAGGAYVPLDPGYPAARLRFMLTDAGVSVLVTETALTGTLGSYDGVVVCLTAMRRSFHVRGLAQCRRAQVRTISRT